MSRNSAKLAVISAAFIGLNCFCDANAGPGSHKVFNVQTYGATGNGTTDDTAAIQAAISAAGANSGSTIFFPAGSYLVSSTLGATGVNIQGQGATLILSGTNTMLDLLGISPSVQGLAFKATATGTTVAVVLTNAKDPTVSGCSFSSNFSNGIEAQSCFGTISVSNSSFVVPSGGSAVTTSGVQNINLTQNQISAVSGASNLIGFNIQSTQGLIASANRFTGASTATQNNSSAINVFFTTSAQVTSNVISGWQGGIISNLDSNFSFTSNTVTNCAAVGILSNTDKTGTIANNIVSGIAGGPGIVVTVNSGLMTISKNQVSSTGSSSILAGPYPAIGSGAGGNTTVIGNQVTNAGLTATTNAVIDVNQANATAISITGNQYKGNASNLTYFIDAAQPASISSVSGNKTNTLLPTKIGP